MLLCEVSLRYDLPSPAEAGYAKAGARVARIILVSAVLFLCLSASLWARTIVMDGLKADRIAAITEEAPRLSWPGDKPFPAKISSELIDLAQGRSFIISFSLAGIPKGQRVIHAELAVPVNNYQGTAVRFYVWRMLADWGQGVCHLYRAVSPEAYSAVAVPAAKAGQLEWIKPGARGYSSDRATRPSAIIRLNEKGEQVVNVTEDIELWYMGAAPNNGWLFTVEDAGSLVRLLPPLGDNASAWKLRITYEPE